MWYGVGFVFCWKEKRQVMGSSDSRCYIDVMSQMSIWTLFWCRVTVFLKCIEQFWQQCQTKLRGRIILQAKSVHSCVFVCVGFLFLWRYVSTFYKKAENKNVFHRANVEQQSNRKVVVISLNTEFKPIWEYKQNSSQSGNITVNFRIIMNYYVIFFCLETECTNQDISVEMWHLN